MKITLKWLEKIDACMEGKLWWQNQKESDAIKVTRKLIKEGRLDWANWLIVRMLNHKQKIQYTIFSAEQVVENFEKFYPDEKRLRNAINAAKLVLKNNTKETREAAMKAGEGTRAAAKTARSVRLAEWAGWAGFAARVAAGVKWEVDSTRPIEPIVKIKIAQYGVSLLEKTKQRKKKK